MVRGSIYLPLFVCVSTGPGFGWGLSCARLLGRSPVADERTPIPRETCGLTTESACVTDFRDRYFRVSASMDVSGFGTSL